MTKEKNSPTGTTDREIVITRVVNAPQELVWEAMTNPEHIIHWWGPRGFTTTIEVMDVRPGGQWKHVMHGPDGTDYPNYSTFTEVSKPERLAFTQGGHKEGGPEVTFEATWTFESVSDDQTQVTIRMVFPTAAARDKVVQAYGAIEGGKQTLERLAEQLAKAPFIIERTFAAPVETVWQAITDFEQMKHWYMPVTSFKPEVGFETQFTKRVENTDYVHLWKITEVVAGKKLTYRWQYAGFPGESFVTFELFAEGTRTRLRLTHVGLDTFQPDRHPRLARKNFVAGWTQLVGVELGSFLEKTSPAAGHIFVISRVFDASRELVWKAWTDPQHMAQWWGPHDFTNPICEMDVRVGGAYRIVMRAPNGSDYPVEGVYREVVKPERLVMLMDCSGHPESWHDQVNPNRDKSQKPSLELIQTVTFEDLAGKTRLTVRTNCGTPAIRDAMVKMGMNEGWTESLERLVSVLQRIQ